MGTSDFSTHPGHFFHSRPFQNSFRQPIAVGISWCVPQHTFEVWRPHLRPPRVAGSLTCNQLGWSFPMETHASTGQYATEKDWELPNLVVSNLVVCNFYSFALFCALLRTCVGAPLRSFCMFLQPTTFGTTTFGNFRKDHNLF